MSEIALMSLRFLPASALGLSAIAILLGFESTNAASASARKGTSQGGLGSTTSNGTAPRWTATASPPPNSSKGGTLTFIFDEIGRAHV